MQEKSRKVKAGAENGFTLVFVAAVEAVEAVEAIAAVEAGRRTSAVFLRLLLTISAPHCQLLAHDPAESSGRDHCEDEDDGKVHPKKVIQPAYNQHEWKGVMMGVQVQSLLIKLQDHISDCAQHWCHRKVDANVAKS